jgi:hypothetical protein
MTISYRFHRFVFIIVALSFLLLPTLGLANDLFVNATELGEKMLQRKVKILNSHPEWSSSQRLSFEEKFQKAARKTEWKRQRVIKTVHGSVRHKLKSGLPTATGTPAMKGGGIVGDVDFSTLKRADVERIAKVYERIGYTVERGGGGSVTIKELNATYFYAPPGGINSELAFYDPEVMKIPESNNTSSKQYKSRYIADNFKKMHGFGTTPPEKLLKGDRLQQLAKATTRIEISQGKTLPSTDAVKAKIKSGQPLTFDEKLQAVRARLDPRTVGVIPPGANRQQAAKAAEAFQKECWKRAQKGYKYKKRLDREIVAELSASYKESSAKGEFKRANRVKKELVQHNIEKARSNKAILKNKGFDDLADLNGYNKKTVETKVRNPKTGKTVTVKKTYFEKTAPKIDPKTNKLRYETKRYTRAGVYKTIRKTNIKAIVRANQIGLRDSSGNLKINTSKKITITKTDAAAYKQKKVALRKARLGGAFLMGVAIYHGGKQAITETESEITADTTNLEIAGKTAKAIVKTAYYASGLGGIEQMAKSEYKKAADDYEKALVEGKDPSLAWAWAVTKGTVDTANELAKGMVTSVTVAPLVQTYEIAEGAIGTYVDKRDQVASEKAAVEMADRLRSYKNEAAFENSKAKRNFEKMKRDYSVATGVGGGAVRAPAGGSDAVTDLEIVYGDTLAAHMDDAKNQYKNALQRAGGKKTPAVTKAFKQLEQTTRKMNDFMANPVTTRKIAKSEERIAYYNKRIASMKKYNNAVRGGKSSGRPDSPRPRISPPKPSSPPPAGNKAACNRAYELLGKLLTINAKIGKATDHRNLQQMKELRAYLRYEQKMAYKACHSPKSPQGSKSGYRAGTGQRNPDGTTSNSDF